MSWSEDDQDKALAWEESRREVCEMCGTRESDWVDPETKRMLFDPPLTPVGMKCHGCAEKEGYRKNNFEHGTPPGVTITFMPTEMIGLDGKIVRR